MAKLSTPAQARIILAAGEDGRIYTANGRTLESMLAKGLIWENREWAHPRYFLTRDGLAEKARLVEKVTAKLYPVGTRVLRRVDGAPGVVVAHYVAGGPHIGVQLDGGSDVAGANDAFEPAVVVDLNAALHGEHVKQLAKGVTLTVQRAITSAVQNANDTARECGFAIRSARWFETYALTFTEMIEVHAQWLAGELERAEEGAHADAETLRAIELSLNAGTADRILTAAPAVVHEGDWTFLTTLTRGKTAFLAEPVDGWLYFDTYDELGRLDASYRLSAEREDAAD